VSELKINRDKYADELTSFIVFQKVSKRWENLEAAHWATDWKWGFIPYQIHQRPSDGRSVTTPL